MSSKNPYILIAEDEQSIATLLEYNLAQAGYDVASVGDGQSALDSMYERTPDLMLLDWMLPEVNGIEICKMVREHNSLKFTPVIMLTARGEERDKVTGLDAGADDYIVKPFSPKELVARVRSVLRRTNPALLEEDISYCGITISTEKREASYDGTPLALSPTELRLLSIFITHKEKTLSREQLLDMLLGATDDVRETRTIDVHIRRLRAAMGQVSQELAGYIRTIRFVGYMLKAGDKVK